MKELVGPLLTQDDVARQAELVVMEYLKSAKCAKTLDAIMTKSSASPKTPSAVASELYATDLDATRTTNNIKSGKSISVLEHIVQNMEAPSKPTGDSLIVESTEIRPSSRPGSSSSSPSASGRRRISVDEFGSDDKSSTVWTKDEVSLLKKAIKSTSGIEDKNERWKEIANIVGNGKSKKHCYLKYKELKEEKVNTRVSGRHSPAGSSRASSGDERDSTSSQSNSRDLDQDSRRAQRQPTKTIDSSISSNRSQVLHVEDCEDFDAFVCAGGSVLTNHKTSYSPVNGRPPTADEVETLRSLLFPEVRKNFSSHWDQQGFCFSEVLNLRYGMVQHEGGPCGVLAVVQAYVLRFLLAPTTQVRPEDWRNPSTQEQEQALALALSHILWQAARLSRTFKHKPQCMIVLPDRNVSKSKNASFMSRILVHTVATEHETLQLVKENMRHFTEARGNGLIHFVLSVLLSKGVDSIRMDMDTTMGNGGTLIGGHDYCTQEMVNLLLCGIACSNVFNGTQLLEGSSVDDPNAIVLKGIPKQTVVGFLSLFEAYEYIQVGSHLKTPQFNIWVICSESHYSVFCAEPVLLQDTNVHDKKKIDLYYYDGLANQDEEIRLTVDVFARTEKAKPPKAEELIPPLNLVVQTKWPYAIVDWNGMDPLL